MPAATVALRDLVDQNEAAEIVIGFVGIETNRPIGREIRHANGVERQCFRRKMLEGIDVDLIFGGLDRRGDGLCRELEPIRSPGKHGFIGHPDDGRFELIGDLRRIVGLRDHIAARAIDLAAEADRDRLAGDCQINIAIESDDSTHRRGLAGRYHTDLVSRLYRPADDQP